MSRRIKSVVAVAAIAGLVILALPNGASAGGVSVCSETNTYTFSPALTVTPLSGSAGFSYTQDLCARVLVNEGGNLVAVPVPGPGPSGGFGMNYFGNCGIVFVDGPGVGAFELRMILGGVFQVTVTSQAATDAHAKVGALVPDNPCPISSTSGSGQVSIFAGL
ncbi:MAG: hypothetical protein ABR613_00695 [Actinomycetota bacterium]